MQTPASFARVWREEPDVYVPTERYGMLHKESCHDKIRIKYGHRKYCMCVWLCVCITNQSCVCALVTALLQGDLSHFYSVINALHKVQGKVQVVRSTYLLNELFSTSGSPSLNSPGNFTSLLLKEH